VSIVLAWGIGRFRLKLITLLPLLNERRNGLNVNHGFENKLLILEKYIFGCNSVHRGIGQRRRKGRGKEKGRGRGRVDNGKSDQSGDQEEQQPIISMFRSGGASRF
jgi:hypothetical protein